MDEHVFGVVFPRAEGFLAVAAHIGRLRVTGWSRALGLVIQHVSRDHVGVHLYHVTCAILLDTEEALRDSCLVLVRMSQVELEDAG